MRGLSNTLDHRSSPTRSGEGGRGLEGWRGDVRGLSTLSVTVCLKRLPKPCLSLAPCPHFLNPKPHAAVCRALAKFGHIPDEAWMDLYWQESYCLLPAMQVHTCVCVWVVVGGGMCGGDRFRSTFIPWFHRN